MNQDPLQLLKNVLSKEEQAELEKFNQYPMMKQAVKKVLLFGIYNNGTLEPGKEADPTVNPKK